MNITILYILASLVVGFILCLIAGKNRPWVAQAGYVAAVLTSLVTAAKLSPIIDGTYISIAIGLYSMTFLLTDYLGEVYDRATAMKSVGMALVASLILIIGIQFSINAPVAPFWGDQEAFATVLGTAPRLLLASILAFVTAQLVDVWIFDKLKKATEGKWMFLRNNISTFVGQTIDTVVFFGIAFYGLVPNLALLIITACIVKYLIAILDTPFLYLAVKVANRD